MVKSAKLWREIALQYAKLEADGADACESPVAARAVSFSTCDKSGLVKWTHDGPRDSSACFYKGGLKHKHWVLFLCALMLMCEWMDRSVLSIAMQPIKEEFQLSDTDIGIMASASLWMVPIAITFLSRVADHLPKNKVLAFGVFMWGACTLATGSSRSFHVLLVSRLFAGLSNCAGYPVAIALIAEFFEAGEMTTAVGYFNAGCAAGGLVGLAAGGLIITQVGWRWAFWGVGSPQLLVALLLVTTVRPTGAVAPPTRTWVGDLRRLLRLPSLLLLMLGALLSGLMSGNHRFIAALAERLHGVDAQTVGVVLGVVLGLTGVFASCVGGHAVDHAVERTGDLRMLLRCAALGDVLQLVLATSALLAPNFGLLVFLLALAVCTASLTQGLDAAVQLLGKGCRGTTQGLLEWCWSVGMGVGPFLTGVLSDSLHSSSCDDGCSLAWSLLLVGGFGLALRASTYATSSCYFRADVRTVELQQDQPAGCGNTLATSSASCCAVSEGGCCRGGAEGKGAEPHATTMGHRAAV